MIVASIELTPVIPESGDDCDMGTADNLRVDIAQKIIGKITVLRSRSARNLFPVQALEPKVCRQ